MVCLMTALMAEAAPIINRYNLKKDMKMKEFQVFRSGEAVLVVTGTGKMKAAMGLVYIIGKYGISESDIVVNIGLCGSPAGSNPGDFFIANKVTDFDTKRDYYPDVLAQGYNARPLVCYPYVVNRKDPDMGDDIIVDMESAGIMEAAYKFLYAHQTVICKIVSDSLTGEHPDVLSVQSFITKNLDNLDNVIKQYRGFLASFISSDTANEEAYLSVITENLKLTNAMTQILRNEVRKAKVKGVGVTEILKSYLEITCRTKDERRKIFDELSKALRQEF